MECENDGCKKINVLCRACRRLDVHCEDHTKCVKHGTNFYCIRDMILCKQSSWCKHPLCFTKLYCTKCDKNKLGQYDGKCKNCEKKTTECLECSGFQKMLNDNFNIVCQDCFEAEKIKLSCKNCNEYGSHLWECNCCDICFCDKCNTKTNVDISPITLYGSGLSSYRTINLCKLCAPTENAVEAVQNSYRNYNSYVCSNHDNAEHLLKKYEYVMYSEYKNECGETVVATGVFNKEKRRLNNLYTDEVYKEYAENHPEKRIKFDGHNYTFPK